MEVWIQFIGAFAAMVAFVEAGYIWKSRKSNKQLQFSLASLSQLSLAKVQSTNNQIKFWQSVPNINAQLVMTLVRARDDFAEIHATALALEGAVDPKSFATTAILKQTLVASELNNKIQKEGLKNPNPLDKLTKE